jgi:hypothetical protein
MKGFRFIVPLDDVDEERYSTVYPGKTRMTKMVQVPLGILRLPEFGDPIPGYHVLDLAGVFLKVR